MSTSKSTMKPKRKRVPRDIEADVLMKSGRRCCLCFHYRGDAGEKPGQVAHLDDDPSNDNPDNLVWLCLEHHDRFDGRTSQSKNFTIHEVKACRQMLFEHMQRVSSPDAVAPAPRTAAWPSPATSAPGVVQASSSLSAAKHSGDTRTASDDSVVSAVFGEGPANRPDQWMDVTAVVKHLATVDPPVAANLANLQLPSTFLHGTPKYLRVALRDGRAVTIKEGEPLDLRSSATAEVPRLTVLTVTGTRAVTENDPAWVHLEAVKTTAANFREFALDEIEGIVNSRLNMRHTLPPDGIDRVLWIEESKRLDKYHYDRIALLREVEQYLPEVRIPVLRDFTKAWRWGRPLPDRAKFVAELEEIEHQANLEHVSR